jgi:hypothetical protein
MTNQTNRNWYTLPATGALAPGIWINSETARANTPTNADVIIDLTMTGRSESDATRSEIALKPALSSPPHPNQVRTVANR